MKATVYAYWLKYDWMVEPKLSFSHTADFAKLENYFPCGSFEAEFDPEPFDNNKTIEAQIKSFLQQQSELHHQIDVIEEKIQNLLCLPYKDEE